MSYHLVIDVETVPQDNIDPFVIDYFEKIRWNKIEDIEEKEKTIMSDLCIHPALAKVFCCVLRSNDMVEKIVGEEQEVLESFWSMIDACYREYKDIQLVTFNGTTFDFNFLETRSAILGVKYFVLPKKRWDETKHFDVRMILNDWNYYGIGSLVFWAKSFGIEVNDEVLGSDIYELYKSKKYEKIIEHCVEDTRITQELYLRMKEQRKIRKLAWK